MKTINESFEAFDLFFNKISDAQLDQFLAEIDATGITGPSVDEYFSNINRSVASFFDEPSETSTLGDVAILFCDSIFDQPVTLCDASLNNSSADVYSAGENSYSMAA